MGTVNLLVSLMLFQEGAAIPPVPLVGVQKGTDAVDVTPLVDTLRSVLHQSVNIITNDEARSRRPRIRHRYKFREERSYLARHRNPY